MIDHISFPVKNFSRMCAFYDQTLAALGYERIMTFETGQENIAGYGFHHKPYFWIGQDLKIKAFDFDRTIPGLHVAFVASSQEAVQTWYEHCINAGGTCNGKPGLRPEYHPGYYAAFIIDPEGWKIEAVHHTFLAEE